MEKIYCPVNAWDCPYYVDGGFCTTENPLEECDDYAAMEACLNDDDPAHIYIFGDR